jgi:hypothetical protein
MGPCVICRESTRTNNSLCTSCREAITRLSIICKREPALLCHEAKPTIGSAEADVFGIGA